MEPVISVLSLAKRYGDAGVRDVSFEVASGEIFGLIGPNGAGKTTTVECLEGLRRRDAGEVRVLGLDPQVDQRPLRRRIGAQLQESELPPRMRVGEALELFASLTGRLDPSELLDQWGLQAKRRTAFGSLSGGERQRLLIALALVNDPELVFLDEMTTGLDPKARRVAWDLIRSIRERGATVVLVTHFMDDAERLCDRIGVMREGSLVALDTPHGLVSHHAPDIGFAFTTDATDVSFLADIACVRRVRRWGPRVEVEGVDPVIALVSSALIERGITPKDLRVRQPTLEDVFLRLTGEAPG